MKDREDKKPESGKVKEADEQDPDILEEIAIEEFAVDGICGVY